MNFKTTSRIATAALGAVLILTTPGLSQSAPKPGGTLRVEGDSTLHKWSTVSSDVGMTFQFAAGTTALGEAIKGSGVKGLDVRVPVASLKSGESGLDKNMRKAMRADEFPDVTYALATYELGKPTETGAVTAKTTGTLTIAGQAKTVPMDVELRRDADKIVLRGSYALKMSDYGIKPPTLMLGAIKVRDAVVVRFDLTLAADTAGAAGVAAATPQKQK